MPNPDGAVDLKLFRAHLPAPAAIPAAPPYNAVMF
jgi:hypothetical protein